MARKPTTASVGDGNRKLALEGLKLRQEKGAIPRDDTVLSIADHGEVIVVYTQHASFGMVKKKERAPTPLSLVEKKEETSNGELSSTG